METVTVRVRSLVWFATGVVLTLVATLLVVNAWRVDAAPGDADTTFVPITPCRLIDTRQPGNTSLGAGETRTFDSHGTNGACTIPAEAVALSLNVTAIGPSVLTFFTFWPDGVPRPEASNLNPAPGQPPTPNAVFTPVSAAGKFNVFNESGTVGMIIDINGFFTKSSLKNLGSRVAHATSPEIDETVFSGGAADILTTTVTAPAAGTLVIGASVDASGAVDDQYTCQVKVDGFIVTGSTRVSRVNWQGVDGPTDRTDNSQENCSTDAAIVVGPGAHTVDFRISGRGTAAFHSATLWAMWVPLDGAGNTPTP